MNPQGQQESAPRPTSVLCLDDASYVLGSLSPAERQAFEQHLSGCVACQASVAKLAGLPGLLALISAADVEDEPVELPATLLPRLLTATALQRRRRHWIWTGTVAAAAASVAALVIVLTVPTASTPTVALPPPVAMKPLVPGPMAVSLQLVDKQWGTSIVVNCHYAGTHDPGEDYQLVAFDTSGRSQSLGWWMSVAGANSTVTTASSIRLKSISRVEVQLANGLAVLSAAPQHS